MSKKRKTRTPMKKRQGQKEFKGFNEKVAKEIESIARRVAAEMIFPFEHAIRQLSVEADNMRANLVATTTVLEKGKIVDRDEYLAVYNQYVIDNIGVVEDNGSMLGRPVFSLYNVEDKR